jgi:acetyltransferase-like isoleucine patch superfamily enzyme
MKLALIHKARRRLANICRFVFYPLYRLYLGFFNIHIASTSKVSFGAILDTSHGGSIVIGEHTEVLDGARLATYGGDIIIGGHSSINPLVTLYGHGGLRIGNRVLIATQGTIIPANHIVDACGIPIAYQGLTHKGIIIENDVWIGSGARILDGVTLSSGSVVGANAVVTKSTKANGIYVGIPARLLRYRGDPCK